MKRAFFLMFIAVFMTALAPLAVRAGGPTEDVVVDGGKDVVRSLRHGTCVVTKWNADSSPCAPKPEPAPAPAPVVQAPPPPPPAPEIKLEQRTVYFDFDKAVLKGDDVQKLDSLIGMIQSNTRIKKATVVGYADIMGRADYNVALSERRASAVHQYLSSRLSIPTDIAEVRGLGATNSVTQCDAKKLKRTKRIECLAQDRRVEVEFTYEK